MDRIEFVIAEEELGLGVSECVEPVINGESLTDIFGRVEQRQRLGYAGYAGLAPQMLFAALRLCFDARAATGRTVGVLRCTCGDTGCSWAKVEVVTSAREVVSQHLKASRISHSAPKVYAPLGPFRFDRRRYEDALSRPRPRAAPVHAPFA
jgi:hypothetical protein